MNKNIPAMETGIHLGYHEQQPTDKPSVGRYYRLRLPVDAY